jgi:predicted MFS family arabinose efflux permease
MGIATSGFGLGGLVFLPLTAVVLAAVGWRATFVGAALLVLAINGTFLALARDDPPEEWVEWEASASSGGTATAEGLYSFDDPRDVYRTPVFWLPAAGFALFYFAQWAVLYHAPLLLEHGGLAGPAAALVLGASGGLGVVIRLVSGALLDRLVRLEVLAAGVLGIMATALLVLATGLSVPRLVAFAVLWGVGSGLGPALEPMLVVRLFGRRHYAPVYGTMDGVDTVVSIPGPWLGALVYSLGGSYQPVLLLYAGAFVVGGLSFGLLARWPSRRVEERAIPARSETPVAS